MGALLQNMSDKRLSKEFKNEMQTLSKVEHLNLVRFLGFLEQGDERLIVVEYVGNGTLREHLDGTWRSYHLPNDQATKAIAFYLKTRNSIDKSKQFIDT